MGLSGDGSAKGGTLPIETNSSARKHDGENMNALMAALMVLGLFTVLGFVSMAVQLLVDLFYRIKER